MSHAGVSLTRLNSSFKVLSLSIEMSWGGTDCSSGPWHVSVREVWSLERLVHSLWSLNSSLATTCLSHLLLFPPLAPLCLCLLSSPEKSRCCCLLRTRAIILLQYFLWASSSSILYRVRRPGNTFGVVSDQNLNALRVTAPQNWRYRLLTDETFTLILALFQFLEGMNSSAEKKHGYFY